MLDSRLVLVKALVRIIWYLRGDSFLATRQQGNVVPCLDKLPGQVHTNESCPTYASTTGSQVLLRNACLASCANLVLLAADLTSIFS